MLILGWTEDPGLAGAISSIAFDAKFCWKTMQVMRRIGKGAEGYGALEKEFIERREQALRSLSGLFARQGVDSARRFERMFMDVTPDGLDASLRLFHDLSWIQNDRIDERSHPRS